MKLIVFLLISSVYNPPSDSIFLKKLTDIKAERIFADNMDNLYIINDNALIKFNQDNTTKYEFSTEAGDKITDLDCSNPHKLIISCADQNKFIITDNMLNTIGNEIYYENIGISGEAIISSAFEGGYYICDKTYGLLYKTDAEFKIEYQNYLNIDFNPIKIRNYKHLLIFTSETGKLIIYNLDLNTKSTLTENNDKIAHKIINDQYFFFDKDNKKIIFKTLETEQKSQSELPVLINSKISDIAIGNKHYFILTESAVFAGDLSLVKK